MGAARAPCPPQPSRRTATDLSVTAHRRCDLLSAAHRGAMATVTARVSVWWRNVVGIRCVTQLRSILGALTACGAELLTAGGRDALPSSASPYHPGRPPRDRPLGRAHRRAGPALQREHRDHPQVAQ